MNLLTSVKNEMVKTANKRHGNKFQLLPAHQAGLGRVYTPTVRNLPSDYPSTIFNAAQKYISKIPSIDFIHHILLQIQIVVSNAPVALVPVNYWFREIVLRQGGNAELLQNQFDDTAQANLLNKCSVGRERAIFKTANMESSTNGKYGLAKPLPVGTHTFFVPLLASVFSAFDGLYLDNLKGDLTLELLTPTTIIASGAGQISATISFDVEGSDLNDSDRRHYVDRYRLHATESQYLQPIRSEFLNHTLTAGNLNTFKLENVDGLCSHQMIMVRPTGTTGNNAGFASWRLLNVGDSNGATLDLTSSSGETRIGGARSTRFIRQHQGIDHMDNDWWSVKPVYHLMYTDNLSAALAGVVNGGKFFKSSETDQIRLKLPAAPVSEVQTVTFSSAPAAVGYYAFTYKGETSASIVANSSVAVMKATLEAMKCFSSRFITVTCSSVASAGTSFTITFTDPEGELVGDLVELVAHDGIAASVATARTVAGVPGLVSGQYDVVVYSYIYHVASYDGTKLSTKLMLQ